MIFKLCNSGKSAVGTREDGATVSYTIEAEEVKQWLLDGGIPEPEFTDIELLANAKEAKRTAIKQDYEASIKIMVGDTGSAEMVSWTKQEAEARDWTADNLLSTPIIDNLLLSRAMGETKAELILKIITKADLYAVAYAQVLGHYHSRQNLLFVAATIQEVEVV